MAARYWAVLFENLRRAVDDLYRWASASITIPSMTSTTSSNTSSTSFSTTSAFTSTCRTCEGDESCIAAREVVMTLGNYTKEFSDLINWLKLKTEYENTPGPQRPTRCLLPGLRGGSRDHLTQPSISDHPAIL